MFDTTNIMEYQKPCKGKDLAKVPASKLLQNGWWGAVKGDGHFVTVHKQGTKVICHTSSGKPFQLKQLSSLLNSLGTSEIDQWLSRCDYILEVELTHKSTELKLGGRKKAAMTTTFRTRFTKGLDNPEELENNVMLYIHDIRYFDCENPEFNALTPATDFEQRAEILNMFSSAILMGDLASRDGLALSSADWVKLNSLDYCQRMADRLVKLGYEGLYMKHDTHTHEAGKRVNLAIKIKPYPTVDLTVIDWNQGTGKHHGAMGSLQCKDEHGVEVAVGGGFKAWQRDWDFVSENYPIGTVIECKYESMSDTYVQPIFLSVHEEKTDGNS